MADSVDVTLIANDWKLGLAPLGDRLSLSIQNNETPAANNIFWEEPDMDNPFALSFDGVDDFVDIDTILGGGPIAASTSGSVLFRINRPSGGVGNDTVFSLGDTNANEFLQIFFDASDIFHARLRTAAGGVQWEVETDNAIPLGVPVELKVVHNGTEATLFVDKTPVPQTFTTSTDKTLWVAAVPGVDNARLGSMNINSGGEAQFLDATLDWIRIYAGTTTQNNRTDVAKYSIDEGRLQSASLTIADGSTNSFTGTLGVGALAPIWVARAVTGSRVPALTREVISDVLEVPQGAIWLFSTVAASVTLKQTSQSER